MALAPLLQLNNVSLTFGGDPVFDAVDCLVQAEDRLALVGRNGSGKSTLMKVMAGLVEFDEGTRVVPPGVRVGYMAQDPDMSGFATLGDFAAQDLAAGAEWRVELACEGLKFDADMSPARASGGERRRAALAKLLAEAPEVLLLDEPTNHLDIEAIAWLEATLKSTRSAFVLISHDRAFLRNLTQATFWIDRGQIRRHDKGFGAFEAWRDAIWAQEDEARHKLQRKIKAEARWAVEGISARRKRNQGRLRALAELRRERADMRARQGTAAMALERGPTGGRRVVEARGIAKAYDDKVVLRPFDLRIMRGDRVAFIGPNGVGKTSLLKMLTGEILPDQGSVQLGQGIEMAVFDQNRASLKLDQTLWENLTGDADLAVSGRNDQVMVRGQARHVIGYLKDFLFDEAQARAPVHSLSGGEKARLLLAKLMAQPSNLLVLDEPTNDLDIETLDLLQDLLGTYDGTVLLVSHDRDFIDRVALTSVVLQPGGHAIVYAGGWSDAQAQMPAQSKPISNPSGGRDKPKRKANEGKEPAARSGRGLSFTQAHRLKELPDEIARIEAELAKLEQVLADPALYTNDRQKFDKATAAMASRHKALHAAEEEWLTLEELADNNA